MTPNTILDASIAGFSLIQWLGRSSSDLTPDGQSLITLEESIRERLAARRTLLIVHSIVEGTKCNLDGFSQDDQRAINQLLRRYDLNATRASERITALIELAQDQHEFRIVILLLEGERCFPKAESGFLTEEQHILHERVVRFGTRLRGLKAENTIIIEAGRATIDEKIEQAATPIVSLHADEEEITRVLNEALLRFPQARFEEGLSVEYAARLLARTPTFAIVQMIRTAEVTKAPISHDQLRRRKQETIEQQSEGTLTVLEPRDNVILVGDYLKPVANELRAIISQLANGDPDTPLFIVLAGPPGVGKTVLVTQVAHEAGGIPVLELQSPLSKWQGEAQRLSKLMHDIRREQYPNIVIADEGRNIATQRESPHDGGTSSALNRDWLSVTTDSTMRARSVICATTNVPDTLFQGAMKSRLEILVVLSPGLSDLTAITAQLCKKHGFAVDDATLVEAASILHAKTASPRDIDNLLRRLKRHHAANDQVLPAANDLLIPEDQVQAAIWCDLNSLKVMNGHSALPWSDRALMPAHIAACLDNDGHVKKDVVRQRLESLSHVRV